MSSCGPRFSKSHTSNTYLSYADQNLYGANPLAVPSCDHWRFCEKVPRRSPVEADSLGSPLGLVCSNATLVNPMEEEEANARNFAIYLKAFALIYVLPEVDWTAEKIDMLLAEGTDLFQASSERDEPEDNQGQNKILETQVYTKEEKRIRRNFNLEGHTFTLALEPRYLGEPARPRERPPTHIIKNLKRILQAFFKSSRYCLLLTRVGHLLIWRRKRVFFVLDVKGRRRDDLQCDKDNGVAMLVCLKTIDNVVHLASNLSGITPKDEFTIRELVVVRLETPDGRIYMRDSSYRSVEFKVVNKSYAYLKATLHISLCRNDTAKNPSSLMVAVGSILASKVDHPANWDTNMLDRLISYGVELCRTCWSDCLRERRPIDLDTFPTQLRLGQFVLELKLQPNLKTGFWKCGVSIIGTDFETRIRETLKRYGNVVFQINNQMYAMWAKDDFYYLLDPYRHTIVGTHVPEDQCEGAKWATVRMFRDQLTMLSVFHQLLKESNRQSTYYLHVVRIRNLAECPKGFVLAPLPENVDTFDVESLNETILFGDQLGASVDGHLLAKNAVCEDNVVGEDEDTFGIENFQLLDERQIAGAAEDKMCQEETETRHLTRTRSKCKKQNPEASKPATRSLKRTKARTRKSANKGQSLGKKETESFKDLKASKKVAVAIQESENVPKQGFPRRLSRMTAEPTRKSTKVNAIPSRVSRQAGGSVSAHSPTGSTEGTGPGGVLKDKWSAKESAIIKLGPKVAATNLIMGRDACEGPSTLGDSSIGQPETIYPETAVRDILMHSMEKSNCLGVAAVANKHFTTPVQSEFGHPEANIQNARDSNNEELHEAGRCSLPERSKSLPRFPGFNKVPQLLAVAGSESGTLESLNRLLGSAFKVANRVLTMTPWGNYVVFRHRPNSSSRSAASWFYLFDGCTCDIDRFRHLDLSRGTAGLVAFRKLSEVVCHMIDSRQQRALKLLCSRVKEKAPLPTPRNAESIRIV